MSIFTTLRKSVPSLLTCSSAFCGMLSTFLALEGEKSLVWAAYLILLAAIFDFSDGFAARLLNACSDMGKELDSLADTISFGVAPTAIIFQYMRQIMHLNGKLFSLETWQSLVLISCLLVAIFAILRLAKFNVDPEQSHSFKGLPSPACAMFIVSIPLIDNMIPEDLGLYWLLHFCGVDDFKMQIAFLGIQLAFYEWYVVLILTLGIAAMMVANMPMFSLKIKHFNYAENKTVFKFLIFSALTLILLYWVAVPIIIITYIIVSSIKSMKSPKAE